MSGSDTFQCRPCFDYHNSDGFHHGTGDTGSDRRADIDAKTGRVAALLREVGCEGLLLLEPENVAWLGSGALARGVLDPAAEPALYCNGEQRWVIASNADAQRIFDEEVDRKSVV